MFNKIDEMTPGLLLPFKELFFSDFITSTHDIWKRMCLAKCGGRIENVSNFWRIFLVMVVINDLPLQ